ncbi:unnamed protein product [Paramecium pentaurelia]|uniref:Uncharacterized protein n=1 Tax=Paramecium pentaurelia TaxID=43138 RepID=A0A8S1U6V4_9CILI|nr:unnamed protein product [Paramecium pentaurelia]
MHVMNHNLIYPYQNYFYTEHRQIHLFLFDLTFKNNQDYFSSNSSDYKSLIEQNKLRCVKSEEVKKEELRGLLLFQSQSLEALHSIIVPYFIWLRKEMKFRLIISDQFSPFNSLNILQKEHYKITLKIDKRK